MVRRRDVVASGKSGRHNDEHASHRVTHVNSKSKGMIMRLKAFGIGAAGILAAGTLTLVSGQHVSAQVAESVCSPTGSGCLEVGASTSNGVIYNPDGGGAITGVPGVYVIAQGSGTNPCVNGNCGANGYIGVSNYETGSAAPDCNDLPCDPDWNGGAAAPGDSNSGGSIGLDALYTAGIENGNGNINGTPVYLVAPVACGFVSGSQWNATQRDGCWEP